MDLTSASGTLRTSVLISEDLNLVGSKTMTAPSDAISGQKSTLTRLSKAASRLSVGLTTELEGAISEGEDPEGEENVEAAEGEAAQLDSEHPDAVSNVTQGTSNVTSLSEGGAGRKSGRKSAKLVKARTSQFKKKSNKLSRKGTVEN